MPVKNGDTVVVHYVGTLSDGAEFDRSLEDSPLVFQVNSGQVIPGFDNAVTGREKGDEFTVTIPAAQAYGAHDPGLMFKVPLDQVPANMEPKAGMLLHVSTDQGELEVKVAQVDADTLTLDANHPLAGQELTFALHIVDIR